MLAIRWSLAAWQAAEMLADFQFDWTIVDGCRKLPAPITNREWLGVSVAPALAGELLVQRDLEIRDWRLTRAHALFALH
jgi:hypothetical protein